LRWARFWSLLTLHMTTTPPDKPDLLTADEVAALLRTTRTAIYVMVSRQQLPGVVRIGRRVLFRRREIEAWLGLR